MAKVRKFEGDGQIWDDGDIPKCDFCGKTADETTIHETVFNDNCCGDADCISRLGQQALKEPIEEVESDKFTDCDGELIEVGDSVTVEETEDNSEFTGTVTGFRSNFVVVEDMDGDSFCVDSDKVVVEL